MADVFFNERQGVNVDEWVKPSTVLAAIPIVGALFLLIVGTIVSKKTGPLHKRIDQNREANAAAILAAQQQTNAAIQASADRICERLDEYARKDVTDLRLIALETWQKDHESRCHRARRSR